ncbi:MAG TPA: Rrf2 family transcriptional regulator [Moheibacter sp.]|nr:Rrf2 family transcriptional regulator [Moheibacter sp.]
MFSKSCEYGIKAAIYITTQSLEGKRIKVAEIAENANSPLAFTAKLLGILTKYNIVSSQTGPNGGFYIEPNRVRGIKLEEIVSAIDGNSVYEGCGLGLNSCDSQNPCPLHNEFIHIRSELKKMLQTTTVYDLAMKLKAGESVLIR